MRSYIYAVFRPAYPPEKLNSQPDIQCLNLSTRHPLPSSINPIAVPITFQRHVAILAQELGLVTLNGVFGPTAKPTVNTRGNILRVFCDHGLVPMDTPGMAQFVSGQTRAQVDYVIRMLGLE